MTEVYLLQNQTLFYFTKQGLWRSGREAQQLYRTAHKDEAINTKVELTVKSPDLRISIITATLSEKGLPQVDVMVEDLPEVAPDEPSTDQALDETML